MDDVLNFNDFIHDDFLVDMPQPDPTPTSTFAQETVSMSACFEAGFPNLAIPDFVHDSAKGRTPSGEVDNKDKWFSLTEDHDTSSGLQPPWENMHLCAGFKPIALPLAASQGASSHG